nr:hypothetical protein [Tanacetum cinerariifolium]
IQVDYDMKATNIILQGISSDIYSLVNHHRVAKYLWERIQLLMQDPRVPHGQAIHTIIPSNAALQTEDLNNYDSNCNDILNAKAVLMSNISNYGFDVILEVPYSETYHNDMENQNVLAMQDFEPPPAVDFTNNEIHITAKLERYKERVKTFEQCLNIDLSSREKMIDSQIDDMIKKKTALREQVESLNKPSDSLHVKIEAPKELSKISVVNESLKKLKFHIAKFDNMVKIRTTPNARTEVFDQMDVAVQQSSVDKQCLEIAKKELLLKNDQLLQQIMSQDVLLTVMNSMYLIDDTVNMDGNRKESCNLEAELFKSQNVFNDLLKIEQAKAKQPLDNALNFSCKHAQQIQELLVYVRDTCSNAINLSVKKIVVTPKKKVKKVRFAEPLTSSRNIKQVVQIVFWYLDSGCSKHMIGNRSQLMNFVSKFMGIVRFGNDHIATFMGKLAKDGLARGIPRLKFQKDHLCSVCKLDAKADIGIFIGYAPAKKAFRIYNKTTQKIIETIHVTFNKLTAIASEQFSSGPGLQCITPATYYSGLVPDPVSQQPCIPPNRDDWDHLFQPMCYEYFNPPTLIVSTVPVAAATRAIDLADSPVSTLIDQDAPSASIPSTQA